VLGAKDGLGEVRVGAPADLLVVRGDPGSDIRALRDVRVVVQRGTVVRAPE
jgi:imidazolonepropionase-like amidohydrolase